MQREFCIYVNHAGSTSITVVSAPSLSGCPVAASDTVHFACIPFDMFDDAGGDALTETFFDSMIPEMMTPFSAVPI